MKPLTFRLLFFLTTITKIGFAILFTSGSVIHLTDQADSVYDFCRTYNNYDCYFYMRSGLLITGAILFFISILIEAFGPNRILIGGTIVPTMFHALGSLLLVVASLYGLLVVVRDNVTNFAFDYPDFEGGFWIASGLITAVGQAYLAFALRSEGLIVIVTYLLASLGSFLFMVVGIMLLQDVMVEYLQNHKEDVYLDMVAGLMISGSVFYVAHGILYPYATYKKAKDLLMTQENPAVSVTNPNVYHDGKGKPDVRRAEEEC